MKPVLLLVAFLAIGCTPAPARNDGVVPPPAAPAAGAEAEQQAIMDRIERDVRLPQGADPLASYGRYYRWWRSEDGSRKVIAVYTNLFGERPGRHWVTEAGVPAVDDGGCGLVALRYDVATQRIEEIACNAVG